jgi:2-polyprenyl-6-methoxyphenol hydroxylase-like FAD-dependent oxidoreductase
MPDMSAGTDILVIGGGLVGASLGFALDAAGVLVTLVVHALTPTSTVSQRWAGRYRRVSWAQRCCVVWMSALI